MEIRFRALVYQLTSPFEEENYLRRVFIVAYTAPYAVTHDFRSLTFASA